MAKDLKQGDFNLTDIGSLFEVDEVTPAYETEQRKDDNGNIIMDRDGKPRKFNTDIIIGASYSVTILEGNFKKKSTQVKVLDPKFATNNEEIQKLDSIKCTFDNLQVSMAGNPMYYRADSITIVEPTKK